MKKFVQIQSSIDIRVTRDYEVKDLNPKGDTNQGVKVEPLWLGSEIVIRKGVGVYPSEIVNWTAVKKLAELKKLTIGGFTDEGTEEAEKEKADIAKVEAKIKAAKPSKAQAPKQATLELGE